MGPLIIRGHIHHFSIQFSTKRVLPKKVGNKALPNGIAIQTSSPEVSRLLQPPLLGSGFEKLVDIPIVTTSETTRDQDVINRSIFFFHTTNSRTVYNNTSSLFVIPDHIASITGVEAFVLHRDFREGDLVLGHGESGSIF